MITDRNSSFELVIVSAFPPVPPAPTVKKKVCKYSAQLLVDRIDWRRLYLIRKPEARGKLQVLEMNFTASPKLFELIVTRFGCISGKEAL